MSTTFLIEAQKQRSLVGQYMTIPSFDFGDTAIRMVDYYNWLHPNEREYAFEMLMLPEKAESYDTLASAFKTFGASSVPVGSVEFALAWFKAMGVDNVKPLNIPKELWHFCERKLAVGYLCDFNGRYMKKDTEIIKSDENGCVELCNDEDAVKEWFLSEWLWDVESEWRVFVCDGKIQDVRCYSGDFWRTPDREYVERVVKEYDNPSYTLDVMVTSKRTEILELHDFFSCGLYGFDDPVLPLMWKRAVRNIIERTKKNAN